MKKCFTKVFLFAALLLSSTAFAQTKFMLDMGLKMPFALADILVKNSGTSAEFGKVTLSEATDDFRFKLESPQAGVELNFKPKFIPQGGVSSMNLDTYFAWYKPTDTFKITAGTSDERHWFKGNEERLVEKFGEITIIECFSDSELGVYYGIIGNPLVRDGSAWRSWGHEEGTVRWDRSYGWSSSQLGNKPDGQGTNLQVAYKKGETGFFATGVLVEHYWPKSSNPMEYEWINSGWVNDGSDNNFSLSWIPEPQFRVGYGFRSGSVELVYKSPHFGNNVVAAFWQPRLFRNKLAGTVGVTFANDFSDGSEIYNKRKNEFTALAFDARFQYNFSEKLKAKVLLNYSMVIPGENNSNTGWHYQDYQGNTVGNLAEMGMFAVASVGYSLPLGTINVDEGIYIRDLDNNDGFQLGENYLTTKASWTWWIVPGAGFSLGGAWYHRLNTADYGKKIRNYVMDGIKDELRLGAYVMVKLGL